ncbi:hypothetical protein M8542_36235 [Amycolatopsis sp. OK19-0408]|uniref:Uncharacterized protein n=1 Tax=Amycolatopsis iheyensis TaxID=2945988 RepID=A0A9X2NGL9_9PSEU|nr:hypothetical protein [Amycolatopsis iheyensis]MCR6488294.1 hypothetical protein [Amycolatopsis iheyensis]
MNTRKDRIIAAVFALTAELDGSWALATGRYARRDIDLWRALLLIGPVGEILRVHEVHGEHPWAYRIEPIFPEDEDRDAIGWNGQQYGIDRTGQNPREWSFPADRIPNGITIPVTASAREAAELIEMTVLPDYRYWSQRIRARNTRRQERLQNDLSQAADIAHRFGGPVNLVSRRYSDTTTCKLPDGRSEITLYTASPRVEMRFVVHRDHAMTIAPDLARLFGFLPS